MPVVHHHPVGRLPLDLEPAATRWDRAHQIDRGLLRAAVTDREGGVQPTPLLEAGVAFVAPVNLAVPRGPRVLRVHWLLRLRVSRRIDLAGELRAAEAGQQDAAR